ncbi:hydrogenase maturation protein [Methylocapsa palsarum]|uniref:Putative two-component system protein, hydrogenase maturation factor HypX/HoxX n=1 Tax=Methylocapsa palsarum TaxID=1612308 RepID=A0A1I4BT31_9HYPH|nr:hydrogenase maturation protein [Methylocapsa palsarum]SFK71560.1 putative two-component system protein, hydrogenase maturation factor HypX/HoxX [Methylocapsa palsarum]
MKILFLTTAHNSLSQRLWIELRERGRRVSVCIADSFEAMADAVSREDPDLIIAPMLKIAIPKEIWSQRLCLIVHPGVIGDRGPSSLDWAIANREEVWGVSVLEAAEDFDAGAIWASHEFDLETDPPAKSSLYRGAVTEAAVAGVLEAVARIEAGEFQSGSWRPQALSKVNGPLRGRLRPPMRQADRVIDWEKDNSAEIVRKIRAADSAPGVLGEILGRTCFLYGAHVEDRLKGRPGAVIARRDGAICLGAADGAVWISHLKAKPVLKEPDCLLQADFGCELCDAEACPAAGIKLPATQVLGPLVRGAPEAPLPFDAPDDHRTFREIVYTEDGEVGTLSFDFYNGAMNTSQCVRLRDAFLYARSRPTRVIVLLGGRDFWSNGIHLNVIEANADPALESWRNINAIDDLIFEILNTMSHFVIAGLRGNAGAGGTMMALAADEIYARPGVVLNPHYRSMGELYGSEYWTYTLPRRVGEKRALELTQSCQPLGARAAREMGFLDDVFGADAEAFEAEVKRRALRMAKNPDFRSALRKKHERRLDDEACKPLANYRAEELQQMRVNFFGPDPAYHEARRRFVYKGDSLPRAASPQPLKAEKLCLRAVAVASLPNDVDYAASL